MQYRDLEQVRKMIKEATDLSIAYAYDDLVFPDHTAFIIQYHKADTKRFIYHHHVDCNKADEAKLFEKLKHTFNKYGCTLTAKSAFQLEQKDQEVEIHFI